MSFFKGNKITKIKTDEMITCTKIVEFDAGHRVFNANASKCEKLHGHHYKVELTFMAKKLDNGIVLDFSLIKDRVKNWIDKHQRREEWIKNNLDKLGTKLNHDLTDYKVFSIFIVSQELPIIYLKETPIDLIPFSRIKNEGITFLDKYN